MKLNQYEWNPENDLIGNGAFAEVFRAKDSNGIEVALKIYNEAVIKGSSNGSFNGKYSLENEFSKGKDLSHTNIIRYINLDYINHLDALQRSSSYPVLIMEYADSDNLESRLKSVVPPDSEETHTIITEIFTGLSYLHSQAIIHRDLKPANILFKMDRMGNKVVKIADFGISRDVLDENTGMQATAAGLGTTVYMAPEQFLKKTYGLNGKITERTDLWSAGVMLYRMLTGKLPFGEDKNDFENIQDSITKKEPDYTLVPEKYRTVIKGCLQKHAADRVASADAALKLMNEEEPKRIAVDANSTKIIELEAQSKPVYDPNATSFNPSGYHQPELKQESIKPKPVAKKLNPAVFYIVAIAIALGLGWVRYHNTTKNGDNSKNDLTKTDGSKKPAADTTRKIGPSVNTNPPSGGVSGYVAQKTMTLNYGSKSYTVVYTGYLANGVPSGFGTTEYKSGDKNGDKFVGQSRDGLANGKGAEYFHDGSMYEGDYQNGSITGSGVCIYANSNKYTGEFANGYRNGVGTMIYNQEGEFKGDQYTGGWKDGDTEGYGTYTWHDGRVYQGNWRASKLNGQGTLTYKDGSKYVGDWVDGNETGDCKIYGINGELVYSGRIENGVRKS